MSDDTLPKIIAFGATDVGRFRRNNEDSFALSDSAETWWGAVCDGLGGAAAGEVASSMAIESFREKISMFDFSTLSPGSAAALISEINAEIRAASERKSEWRDMGTTIAAVLVDAGSGSGLVVHAGDSRVYLLREDELHLLTRDHNVSEDLMAIQDEAGLALPFIGSGHELTRCLGLDPFPGADAEGFDLEQGDRILICSDGLTNVLAEKQIAAILAEGTPQGAVEALIDQTLGRGAPDNVTALVAEYV